MRVNQNSNPSVDQTNQANRSKDARQTSSSKKTDRASDVNIGDSVNTDISSKAKDFQKAKEIATGAPDVREEKIAELKRRIANKEYNVKPEAIADRIVDEHIKTNGIL